MSAFKNIYTMRHIYSPGAVFHKAKSDLVATNMIIITISKQVTEIIPQELLSLPNMSVQEVIVIAIYPTPVLLPGNAL